jgi:uncharacterized protein YfkK (UPF0435 family)
MLITDITNLSRLSYDTIKHFIEIGHVKSIRGLHAKIYIFDNSCIITSANLTNTAFTKRTEIGVLLNKEETISISDVFNGWWGKADLINKIKLLKKFNSLKKKVSDEEASGEGLEQLYELPPDPGKVSTFISKRYLRYDDILEKYNDLVIHYTKIQRIWKNVPIYFETDAFLNYLYHDAYDTPSNDYSKAEYRKLSNEERIKELKYYAHLFKKYITIHVEDENWRTKNHKLVTKLLSPRHISRVTKDEIEDVFNVINSQNAYGFNKINALKNNLKNIRKYLTILLHGKERINERFQKSNKLNNFKEGSMYELLGLYYPLEYPMINNNALSGLRFFGYDVSIK